MLDFDELWHLTDSSLSYLESAWNSLQIFDWILSDALLRWRQYNHDAMVRTIMMSPFRMIDKNNVRALRR